MQAAPVRRGCGYRQSGGAYFVTETSPFGTPIEAFIIDPPRDASALDISKQGMTLFELAGHPEVPHVMNWVGESNYPNVADFVEEVRRFGASSRVPLTFEFGMLVPGSYIYHIHARAIIENAADYYLDPPIDRYQTPCPSRTHSGFTIEEMCARLWWQDVVGGVNYGEPEAPPSSANRYVTRTCGDTTYWAFKKPQDVTPSYVPGVFLRLPIHGVEVVRDDAAGAHEPVVERIEASGTPMPITVVDF